MEYWLGLMMVKVMDDWMGHWMGALLVPEWVVLMGHLKDTL